MRTDSKQGKRRLCFAAIAKALKKDLEVAQEERDRLTDLYVEHMEDENAYVLEDYVDDLQDYIDQLEDLSSNFEGVADAASRLEEGIRMFSSMKTTRQSDHVNMYHTRTQNLHFEHFDIAGFSYWEGCMVMTQLEIGTRVELVREADNRFDPYAVAVRYDGYKLGYIPRTCNEKFCALLDQGYSDMFDARIQRITKDAHMEHQIGVIVYLKRA